MTEPVGNSPRDIPIPTNSLGSNPPPTPKPGPRKKTLADQAAEPKEQRELTKIVEGKVVVNKQSWWKRAARSMIADDATSVGDYLLTDVFVPSIKRLIADLVQSSTDRVLFGTTSRRRGFGGGLREERGPSIRTRYDRMAEEPRGISRDARARHDFTDVSLDNRQEAIDVVDELIAYVVEYGSVSVAQLYTLLGVTGSYADQRWGWTDLATADVKQSRRGGWVVDLPAPEPLR